MSLRLEVIAGNAAGTEIQVDDELVIGRHATGPGRLSEDTEISRQHARLAREISGDYAIEDLGSSNGTFVNGLRLAAPQLLAEGDSIEVGATTLVVRSIAVAPAPAEQPPPPPPAPGVAPTVFARAPALADAADVPEAAADAPDPIADAPEAIADAPEAAADAPGTPAQAPAATEAPSPAAEVPPPAAEVPPLALRIEVDFEAREATIALGDDADELRLTLDDGRWRARRTDA
jgi:ABC transport system ATP-binding/permease protein